MSTHALAKKIKKVFHNGELSDDAILVADLGNDDNNDDHDIDNDNGNGDNTVSEAENFTVGDTIGKSLALIKQVSM